MTKLIDLIMNTTVELLILFDFHLIRKYSNVVDKKFEQIDNHETFLLDKIPPTISRSIPNTKVAWSTVWQWNIFPTCSFVQAYISFFSLSLSSHSYTNNNWISFPLTEQVWCVYFSTWRYIYMKVQSGCYFNRITNEKNID